MSQKISFSRSEGIPTLISQKSCWNIYTIYVLSLCLIEKIFARCDLASDSHQLPIFPSSFFSHLRLPSQRETKILLSLFFRLFPSWKHKLASGININCVNIERTLLIWLSNLYWNFGSFSSFMISPYYWHLMIECLGDHTESLRAWLRNNTSTMKFSRVTLKKLSRRLDVEFRSFLKPISNRFRINKRRLEKSLFTLNCN